MLLWSRLLPVAQEIGRFDYMGLKVASAAAALLVWSSIGWAQAGAQGSASATAQSTYDKIWKFAQLYNNEENPVVQNLLFTGRFQHEYAALDAEEGSHDEWNVRRLRLGARSRLLRAFTLHGEVELNPQEGDPVYVRITDMYVQWSKSGRFELTVGKHGASFTMDGSTSSKELFTIDRNNLSNNLWFPQEYIPGISAGGELAGWVYQAGVYSAGAMNREFGEFSGSFFTLATVGYDFAQGLGVNQALLAGNYIYQNPDRDNTFTRELQHVVSANFKVDAGKWGARADVSGAAGYLGQGDLWGLMAMPFVNITDKLQFVGRYTFIQSDDPNGVRLALYENRVVPGRGDRYNEAYGGASYYFYGHKLKLQSGLQYAKLKDDADDGGAYSGVSWTTGLRVSW